jgi:hypothetical protein
MLQIDTGWLNVPQISKFLHFFDFFKGIFLKMTLKNNVCLNLNTETSKYRLNVSQLSHQYFTGFLLSLLSKNRSTFFLEISKNHISSYSLKLQKTCVNHLQMYWGILDKNLSHFANISSDEIDFAVWNSEKSSVIWRSKIEVTESKKARLKRLTY